MISTREAAEIVMQLRKWAAASAHFRPDDQVQGEMRCWMRQAADALTPQSEGSARMVTVYDHEGRYVGCMGIERWQSLLREGNEPLPTEPDPALISWVERI